MSDKPVTITFQPYDITVEVARGENILRAALAAGIYIEASCGGAGACGKCLIKVLGGETDGPGADDSGLHRACRTCVQSDTVVEIPEESRLEADALESRRARSPISPAVFEKLNTDWRVDPPKVKYHHQIDPPTIENNRSDVSRVARAVKNHYKLDNIRMDPELTRRLSGTLREKDWSVTSTVYLHEGDRRRGDYYVSDLALTTLTNVEPGDTTDKMYGLAVDIGTTGLCAELINLRSGEVAASESGYNPQIRFGADVLSRIVFSQKGDGLLELQKTIIGGINEQIEKLLSQAGVERDSITQMAVAGNTTMTHLFLGLDPKYLREAPYVPATNFVAPLRAAELGIELGHHVILFVFPSIASYMGGDITAGLLATGVYQNDALTLYIDVGTNGEVAVGNADWIMTASCSAGPAFEGGGIEHGMIATPGAIEDFNLNPKTFEPMLLTVGMEKPRGICGSGLISAAADLFRAGVLAPNGKYETGVKTERLRKGKNGLEYVLAWKKDTAVDHDIVLGEADLDNLLRAKGAMYAGYQTLLDNARMSAKDLDRVIIAGAFGSYLDLESAITIGLLPDLDRDKFLYVGNGSLAGARLLNLSRKMIAQAETVSKMMTNIELSDNTAFMDNYMASMFFPHTNPDLFPSVKRSGT